MNKLRAAVLGALSMLLVPAQAQTPQSAAPGEADALPAVTVQGAGEAAAPYAGGQVATQSAVGILGHKHFMETPFASTAYTEEAIRNSQAHDMAAVLRMDPAVHVPSSRNLYETWWCPI